MKCGDQFLKYVKVVGASSKGQGLLMPTDITEGSQDVSCSESEELCLSSNSTATSIYVINTKMSCCAAGYEMAWVDQSCSCKKTKEGRVLILLPDTLCIYEQYVFYECKMQLCKGRAMWRSVKPPESLVVLAKILIIH